MGRIPVPWVWCLIIRAERPPEGRQWRYELKPDGYRELVVGRDGARNSGHATKKDFTRRFAAVAKGHRRPTQRHGNRRRNRHVRWERQAIIQLLQVFGGAHEGRRDAKSCFSINSHSLHPGRPRHSPVRRNPRRYDEGAGGF